LTSQGRNAALLPVSITALGVVYGDIGTSPLYAMRECFFGPHAVVPTYENVLGVLSLILYALIVIVSFKYIVLVMRADNQGEGGILALMSLVPRPSSSVLILLGIFGAALLYGDGMITPAVSILGAVEGLNAASPVFEPWIVPISVVILVMLFTIQQYGTHRVGGLFGPVMIVWFVTLAVLGIRWIVQVPQVLGAIDPRHAYTFFADNGWAGFAVLGAVFLAVTGGEALYADMGHFGRRPIRVAWFAFVLPALVINYFGQGALLLVEPDAAPQVFFRLAPSWLLLPLVGLSTAAAIIASQALISGAFSLTRQAVQLGYVPRLDIDHTSARAMGQVYVPQVNWGLMICTIAMVIGFGSSSRLAAAYGIAVNIDMVLTAILLYVVATERWKWPRAPMLALTAAFLVVDLAFFGANMVKFIQGGWVAIVIGVVLFTVMTTWKTGRRLVAERLTARATPLEDFCAVIASTPPLRVPGTAVFMTAQPQGTPPALAHNVRYNKVLHEHVIILTVRTTSTPHVHPDQRVEVEPLGHGLFNVRVQYGFMEDPDVPLAMARARELGAEMDDDDVTYFLGRETIIPTRRRGMALWREKLFVVMARNAQRATAFFRLPAERVVELGVQVEV
jgi:KUP system potassium uptake protein